MQACESSSRTEPRSARPERSWPFPLPLQRRLRFDPPLPEHRRLALERARYGEVVKAALPYDPRLTGRLPELSAAGFVYQPDPGVPLLVLFAAAGAARQARAIESLAAVD